MTLKPSYQEIESVLIDEALSKYLNRPALSEDHTKCEIGDHDPFNKILSYDNKKLGVIKYIFPTSDNIEFTIRFVQV
jgi:hypothetical protein